MIITKEYKLHSQNKEIELYYKIIFIFEIVRHELKLMEEVNGDDVFIDNKIILLIVTDIASEFLEAIKKYYPIVNKYITVSDKLLIGDYDKIIKII